MHDAPADQGMDAQLGTALVASVLAEVYSAVPEEAALTAVLSNAASMVSLMLFIFLLQGAGCL